MKCVFQGCQVEARYIYSGFSFCETHCNPTDYWTIYKSLVDCAVTDKGETLGLVVSKKSLEFTLNAQKDILEAQK